MSVKSDFIVFISLITIGGAPLNSISRVDVFGIVFV